MVGGWWWASAPRKSRQLPNNTMATPSSCPLHLQLAMTGMETLYYLTWKNPTERKVEVEGGKDVTLSAADADGSIRLPNFRIIGKDHQLGKYSKQQIEYKLIDILVKVQYKSRGCTKKIEMDAVALFGERIGSLLLGRSLSLQRYQYQTNNTQQFQL